MLSNSLPQRPSSSEWQRKLGNHSSPYSSAVLLARNNPQIPPARFARRIASFPYSCCFLIPNTPKIPSALRAPDCFIPPCFCCRSRGISAHANRGPRLVRPPLCARPYQSGHGILAYLLTVRHRIAKSAKRYNENNVLDTSGGSIQIISETISNEWICAKINSLIQLNLRALTLLIVFTILDNPIVPAVAQAQTQFSGFWCPGELLGLKVSIVFVTGQEKWSISRYQHVSISTY